MRARSTRTRHSGTRQLAAGLLAAGLLVTGCGGGEDDASGTTAAIGTVTAEEAAYRDAVRATIDLDALETGALIRVATASGVAEVRIDARRVGDSRTLTVRTDQGELTYVVTPGGATVDRGDGPTPVEVAEVPTAPSLELLLRLDELTFVEPGIAQGTLPADEVDGLAAGPVRVTVRYAVDGLVEGVELRGPDDDYVALVTYRPA